jgi:hypothetical protein
VRVGFSKWWLLPLGVLSASALVVLGFVVVGPSFSGGSSAGVAHHAAAGTSDAEVADCSGTLAIDYACYEERYHDLVLNSGVEATFAELKDEHEKNGFVRVACHDLTHVIGHAAGELYGDLATAYDRGDPYCAGGYYHGVTASVVAKMGADKVLEDPDALCADLRGQEERSFRHYSCAHGMGHSFMGLYENELFESLEACDALTDGWERDACYGGVFIENATSVVNPSNASRYLKVDQPLYPCTDVADRYKNQCYDKQAAYALYMRNNDYAEVFDLCATVEDDPHPACYQGLGASAAAHTIKYVTGEAARARATRELCLVGQDDEARSNCVIGAVRNFIHYYNNDEQAKALCEILETDLRTVCLRRSEDENFA